MTLTADRLRLQKRLCKECESTTEMLCTGLRLVEGKEATEFYGSLTAVVRRCPKRIQRDNQAILTGLLDKSGLPFGWKPSPYPEYAHLSEGIWHHIGTKGLVLVMPQPGANKSIDLIQIHELLKTTVAKAIDQGFSAIYAPASAFWEIPAHDWALLAHTNFFFLVDYDAQFPRTHILRHFASFLAQRVEDKRPTVVSFIQNLDDTQAINPVDGQIRQMLRNHFHPFLI